MIKRFYRYLKYLLTAKPANSIHSPFVFDLYYNLILDDTPFYAFNKIEDLRLLLENDSKQINMQDFGASGSLQKKMVSVKNLARKSATRAKYGQLLFRMVNRFKPQNILELGTSLGLGTLYLASPDSKFKVVTLEGSPEIAEIAEKNFQKLKVKNIELITGNFDETLSAVLQKIKTLDFVFFDGNHRKEPTLQYFQQCLRKSHSESVFIFDDIHWSDEMELAWREIQKNEQVKVTIDLFFFGLVFFREGLTKQNFVLRF